MGHPDHPDIRIGSFSYDPAGFPDAHVDSLERWSFNAGDTLNNVFVLQTDNGKGWKTWHITGIQCKFLAETGPPFPISQALASFNRHQDSIAIATGKGPRTSKTKLGPVFHFTQGDPGLLVKAHHDKESWFINQLIGSGDCPAGCTEHTENIYRIEGTGKVSLASTRHFYSLCFPMNTLRRPMTPIPFRKGSGLFQADGRQVKDSPSSGSEGLWIFPWAAPKR
jgi:hypothetical protein